MTPEPFVSVVIPFYNTAAYLAEAIESVLAQTYQCYEIVLVDNRSTDGSRAIAENYVDRDPRIRLVRNETFLTQVQNYNHALVQIAPDSRYCKIVQADDTIYPSCLTDMVSLAEANPSVGVVSAYRLYGTRVFPPAMPDTRSVMTGRDACRLSLIDDVYMFGSPTTSLLRSDTVRRRVPFYTEGHYFEDSEVVYEVLRDCDFGFVHQILSFQRVQEDSIWGQMRGFHPGDLSRLIQLKKYGPEFLEPGEFTHVMREHERYYRRVLATAWLLRRESEFWDFHRKGLAEINQEIDRAALIRDAVPVALQYLLSPARVAKAAVRRIREKLRKNTGVGTH